MPTPSTQEIQREINKLDYMEGTGVLNTPKRKLTNNRFLFISSGGTGAKTLIQLRSHMARWVEKSELEQKVRYLAIDGNHDELDRTIQHYNLSASEYYKIPYQGAQAALNPGAIDPQTAQWVDPQLYQETNVGSGNATGFGPNGCGAWRQVGRVRLSMNASITGLRNLLQTHITDLNRAGQNTGKMMVFFLAGLAGGTGSGTIVDLAFLCHRLIRDIRGDTMYRNTSFNAYLMLPDACDGAPSLAGNQNAYAALKEIDYFMTLQERGDPAQGGEHFRVNFHGFEVDVARNIFDFCTLVGGVTSEGGFFENPGETARMVTANSILNVITAQSGVTAAVGAAGVANTGFFADDFFSNTVAQVHAKVAGTSCLTWPRNANYHYHVIGYARCVVPVDLITVYIANAVFNEVWRDYDQCKNVQKQDAYQFLALCGLEPKTLYKAKPGSEAALPGTIQQYADEAFSVRGPYYTINLLNLAVKLLKGREYLGTAQQNAAHPPMLTRADRWAAVAEIYQSTAMPALSSLNQDLYTVYTGAINALRELLRKNGRMITETTEFQKLFDKTFCWSPIDLTNGENASTTVKTWLAQQIPDDVARQAAARFKQDLYDKRAEWTGAGGSFDPAAAVRAYVTEQFQCVVSTTVETFLLKLYGGANALTPTQPPNLDPEGHRLVQSAANQITNHLSGSAGVLLVPEGGFYLADCYNNNFVTVPQMTWLDKAIETEAKLIDPGAAVYNTSARDEIVFYRLYAGVPAWAIAWVNSTGEPAYEQNPDKTGLHIEWKRDGRYWTDYPSLGKNASPRELGLRREAAGDLEAARRLGLVEVTPAAGQSNMETYRLRILTDADAASSDSAGERLWNALSLGETEVCTMEDIAVRLCRAGELNIRNILYVGTQTATALQPVPPNLGWETACGGLRRQIELWSRLKQTLPVAERLRALLDEHNATAALAAQTAVREQAFFQGMCWNLIYYNSDMLQWELFDPGTRRASALSVPADCKIQQEISEYLAAQAFYAMDRDAYDSFAAGLREIRNAASVQEKKSAMDRANALTSRFQTLRNQRIIGDGIKFPMASTAFDAEAVRRGLNADAVRGFYDTIGNYLA